MDYNPGPEFNRRKAAGWIAVRKLCNAFNDPKMLLAQKVTPLTIIFSQWYYIAANHREPQCLKNQNGCDRRNNREMHGGCKWAAAYYEQ